MTSTVQTNNKEQVPHYVKYEKSDENIEKPIRKKGFSPTQGSSLSLWPKALVFRGQVPGPAYLGWSFFTGTPGVVTMDTPGYCPMTVLCWVAGLAGSSKDLELEDWGVSLGIWG